MTTRINGREVIKGQCPTDSSKFKGYKMEPHTQLKEERFYRSLTGALDDLLATEPGSEEAAAAVGKIQEKGSTFKNTRNA